MTAKEVIRTNFDRLVTATRSNIGELASKAFQHNLISQENLDDAGNPMFSEAHRARKLLSQILDRVEQNEDHFHTFMNILKDIPTLKDLGEELSLKHNKSDVKTKPVAHSQSSDKVVARGTTSNNKSVPHSSKKAEAESSSLYKANTLACGFEVQDCRKRTLSNVSVAKRDEQFCESFESIVGDSSDDSNDTKEFPHLNLDGLNKKEKRNVISKLRDETEDITSSFEMLVADTSDTFDSLEDQEVSAEKLRANTLLFGQQKRIKLYDSDKHIDELLKTKQCAGCPEFSGEIQIHIFLQLQHPSKDHKPTRD